MRLSDISNYGWTVIGIVAIFVLIVCAVLLYSLVKQGRKIHTPLGDINEDEGQTDSVSGGKNVVQRSTINGHVGDLHYHQTTTKLSTYERNVYSLCISVLEFAKKNDNMVNAEQLKDICGDYDEAVYQTILNENVFHSWKNQRKLGLGKMLNKDIDRLIVKYNIELSKNNNYE